MGYMKSRNLKMGMVIDLTKSGRFYKRDELEKQGVLYKKLACAGHQATPTPDQVQIFISVCKHFWSQHPNEIIGVHCTHGFNRTGYMIAAFLVEQEGCQVEAAIKQFAKARPPGILKAHYLDDLCQRFDGEIEMCPTPPLPDWFDEEENGEDVEDTIEDDASASHHQGRKRKHDSAGPSVPMDGVENVFSVTENVDYLKQRCCELCGMQNSRNFPGAQPVSLDTNNIKYFSMKPYRVSWKADGTRYLMMILGPGQIYLADRKMLIFHAPQLVFPLRGSAPGSGQHLTNTLVDGELVIDDENGVKVPRYYIYDMMSLENKDVGRQLCHVDRYQKIEDYIIGPRRELEKHGLLNKTQEPFRIRNKPFWNVERTKERVIDQVIPSLLHPNDGLIFSPASEPYKPATNPDLLKWKPPELNSVDFLLRIRRENREGELPRMVGDLMVTDLATPFSQIRLTKELKQLHNQIIECKWERPTGWAFMRVREDKARPNSYRTAESVCNSIKVPVTESYLLEFIEKCRYRPPQAATQQHRPASQPPGQPVIQKRQVAGGSDKHLMPPPPAPTST